MPVAKDPRVTRTLSPPERLERVLRRLPVDRVPIRLWGVNHLAAPEHRSWQSLHDLVEEFALDQIVEWRPLPLPGTQEPGRPPATAGVTGLDIRVEERDTHDPEWYEAVYTIRVPDGYLTRIDACHRGGRPGYTVKHLVESVDDAHRWLSLPEGELPSLQPFAALVTEMGDRGMVMTQVSEPMYMVNDAVGSELWGYWMYDERQLVHEMVSKAQTAILKQLKHYLAGGVGPLFGWSGPELCIPPLASPRDFDDFCVQYDKPMADLVHDAGGLVWVHCHGDMDPVLERFVGMGVDCLNPIEPPPVGKLTLADAKRRVGGRMALEGGIEIGDFELESPDAVAATVAQVMAMGKPDGGFIICPSSDPTHWPDMSPHIAANYRVFVETAYEHAWY